MKIPTRLLRLTWPPNPGLMPGNSHFDSVVDSIRQNGILDPVTIMLDWSVIDGAHRLEAARLLGIESVEVRVWTGVEFVQ